MRAKVISNEVFVPSPGRGVGVMGGSYYTTRDGLELVSIHSLTSRSDTTEMATRISSTSRSFAPAMHTTRSTRCRACISVKTA